MIFKNKTSWGFSAVLILITVSLLLVGSLYLILRSGITGPKDQFVPDKGNKKAEVQEYRIDFSYVVKEITDEKIILSSKLGDLKLPNDPNTVKAYKGLSTEQPAIPLSELKVGDELELEVIPKTSAKLFVK